MRLFNTTLVVLAAVLLASCPSVSQADQIGVSTADGVHSSHDVASEDKRFLRRHQTAVDKAELDNEERKWGLLSANRLTRMKDDELYRFKSFKNGKTMDIPRTTSPRKCP